MRSVPCTIFVPSLLIVPGLLLAGWIAALVGTTGCDRSDREKTKTVWRASDRNTGTRTEGTRTEGELQTTDDPIRIPFQLTAANNILVEARINGTEELCLMFHTAVSGVTLTDEVAGKRSSFRADESIEIESWGGTTRTGILQNLALEIDECKWTGLAIPLDRFSGPGSAGKFGPDLFDGKAVEINFDHLELRIHSELPRSIQDGVDGYRKIGTRMEHGSFLVEANFQAGTKSLRHWFLLHSGFGGTVLLDKAFVQAEGLEEFLEAEAGKSLKDSFGHPLETRQIRLASFSLGGLAVSDVVAGTFGGELGGQATSVLGGELLQRFNILLDLQNDQVYVAPRSGHEKSTE